MSVNINFRSIFFYFVLLLLFISIFPWSIKDFLKHQPELLKQSASVFPQNLPVFAKAIKDEVNGSESVVYISQNGAGEKEFFMLSYLLYPRKIIWISDVIPGPISWWTEGIISETGISRLGEEKNIHWIITDDYDLVNTAKKIIKIKETANLRLYKIL